MSVKSFISSESVTEGHPDKICDRISDSILDEFLRNDPDSRVACEVTASKGLIHVMGEISSKCYVDIEKVVRRSILEIGYNSSECGFDGNSCGVVLSINEQSKDISMGVDADSLLEVGAGDQGIMFGFACNETETLMPSPIFFAHKLSKRLSFVRKNNILNYLYPDGKTQVTFEYEDDKPVRIDSIVVSSQHSEGVKIEKLRSDIKECVIDYCVGDLIDSNTKIFINPTGRFVIGGPSADCGLTGRKILVDLYGGSARVGGGALSGKDGTKVDRSGNYMARYISKNIVSAKLSSRCEVQLAYVIGVSDPVSLRVDTFGTSKISDYEIENIVKKNFDLRPGSIIGRFNLRKPIFAPLSSYGQVGREDLNVPWEQTFLKGKL